MSELEVLKEWNLELLPDLIRRIFRQVLEREYTPFEFIDWGFKLNRGETSIKAMIRELALTEEHEDRFIRPFSEDIAVKYCFNHILGRDPTLEETETWIDISLNEGIDDVINRLLDSDEYDTKFGEDGMAFERQLIHGGDIIYLQANNDLYVCAENGGGKELASNRWKPLGWETFVIEKVNGEGGDIMDGELIRLRASNGNYVNIKKGDTREVIATSWNPHDAEGLTIGKITEGGEIGDGEFVWLRSQEGQYVSINSDDQRLFANETEISERVQFIINIQQLR
ncbi:MAG: phycobilisome rod-core linker polypeptide [Candidatus Hermodarchaeota archaeon]